jgi:ribonuclease HI
MSQTELFEEAKPPQPDPSSKVELWTDGACSVNPGPGGWAAILVHSSGASKELQGGEAHTTNNRMELMAVIGGLEALRKGCLVLVNTDSAYVLNAFEEGWIEGWRKRGWKTKAKKPVANQELWERLYSLVQQHHVSWNKVKGHSGVEYNERADQLAVAACDMHR